LTALRHLDGRTATRGERIEVGRIGRERGARNALPDRDVAPPGARADKLAARAIRLGLAQNTLIREAIMIAAVTATAREVAAAARADNRGLHAGKCRLGSTIARERRKAQGGLWHERERRIVGRKRFQILTQEDLARLHGQIGRKLIEGAPVEEV